MAEAVVVWTRIALLSFGGPAGQIAVMHRILVEEKRWIGEGRFLHALNFCMLLPGPEAQQLTVYIGWLMHRKLGGLIAGVLFILPGLAAIMALSWVYSRFGEVSFVSWLFFGLKAAVLAIVLNALVRIGGKALKNTTMASIAIASFFAIFVLALPFPVIIVVSGLMGYCGGRAGLTAFSGPQGHGAVSDHLDPDASTLLGDGSPVSSDGGRTGILTVTLVLLVAWLLPTLALLMLLGADHVFSNIAVFFSQMAVVTFGGAYAVLAYVAQSAVDTHGWLKPGEMLDGLSMAETTPGPLIMVTQFVGYMAAFRDSGNLSPLLAGTLGGLLTTWVTFVPCFMWIFLGAPHIERLRRHAALSSAMTAITAAVVGVILNLAIWFALHVWFHEVDHFSRWGMDMVLPRMVSLDTSSLALSVVAALAVFRFGVGTTVLLAGMGGAGLLMGWLGLIG